MRTILCAIAFGLLAVGCPKTEPSTESPKEPAAGAEKPGESTPAPAEEPEKEDPKAE